MRHWRIDGPASIVSFAILSMVLAWVVSLPLWLGKGINDPNFTWIAMAMMFTPTIAALTISLIQRRGKVFVREVGIIPIRRPLRFISAVVLAYFIPVALVVQAAFVGTWLGVFPGDLSNFVVFKFASAQTGPTEFILSLALVIAIGGLVNLLAALGEEIGWRGWLWPKLQRLGTVTAILVSGIIWGLWHAPLILLGYNYPNAKGAWGLILMCGMCVVVGAFLAWLRTFSASIWPAAFAHGVFNASAGLISLFTFMGAVVDTKTGSILGWSGWLLPAVILAVMIVFGAFSQRAKTGNPQIAPVGNSEPVAHTTMG